MIKFNIALLFVIFVVSGVLIYWHYEERIYFNELQNLYNKYDTLISINKINLSNHAESYSLLKIEQYAKENLAMSQPKIKNKL